MGVSYLSSRDDAFEKLYLSVREKEQRVFTDDELALLPDLKNHPLAREWRLRKKSAMRFLAHLKKKKRPLRILDVGCGNGWFSHMLSTVENTEVAGLDVNQKELEQADSVFKNANLKFVYANLYENTPLLDERFDIVVFNSCFQYFEDVDSILDIAKNLLVENGEIHILDTPFYLQKELENAKRRTHNYYQSLGFPEMSDHYFHHTFAQLRQFSLLYTPSIFSKLLKDSPFCWIKIKR